MFISGFSFLVLLPSFHTLAKGHCSLEPVQSCGIFGLMHMLDPCTLTANLEATPFIIGGTRYSDADIGLPHEITLKNAKIVKVQDGHFPE